MSRNKYAVARRSIWYVLRTLLIVAGVVLLSLGVFITAMYISNIYILCTEGLELRSEVILQKESVNELTEYFSEEFISNDNDLYLGKYDDYSVSTFDYRVTVEGVHVLPWYKRATMTVVTELASASYTYTGEGEGGELPEWPKARYTISFTRIESRWYISGMTLVEENPDTGALPTPDMSLLSPSPSPAQ